MELWEWAAVGGAAVLAAGLGSVAGTGGTAVLLPVLLAFFPVKEALPILTVANLVANVSRAWLHRREVVWPVAGWFVLGALPLNVLGAWLFTRTSSVLLTRLVGGLLVLTVAWRWLRPRPPRAYRAVWFLPLGAGFGFGYGLVEGLGPLMAPFFLAYGLVKGAYIGTDALGTALIQITKAVVFGGTQVLDDTLLAYGLALAPFMVVGTVAGRYFVGHLPERGFRLLIEVTLLVVGVGMLLGV